MNSFSLYAFFLFSFLISHFSLHSFADLETGIQEFVLETQRIQIPGHPEAFNPSIVRWRGGLLMSFREIPLASCLMPNEINSAGDSRIGLVWLDEDFNPISIPQMLFTEADNSSIPFRSEDARLLTVGKRLYIIYSDNHDEVITEGGFRMYVSELKYDGEFFYPSLPERLSCYEGENSHRREKNWVPFSYKKNLLLAYSINPHLIFKPQFGTETCETISWSRGDIHWPWGELRGGTQALLIDDCQYLGFFHSSIFTATCHSEGKNVLHYFIGAYTFAASPPFQITQISPEPIIGKGFYHGNIYKPYWKPVQVVFPGGFIFDDCFIWIAYGRQDHEIWIAKLDKHGLLNNLIPVTTIESRINPCAEFELKLQSSQGVLIQAETAWLP